MKIIQSFWAKPAFEIKEDFLNDRKIGGWLNYKYFLLSSAYSCLTLNRFHKKLELYTDSLGFDIFVEQLKLPYSNVHLTLNELKDENPKVWILGKLKAIRSQLEPFIHVDNDIFIWEKFPSKKSKFLIAQSEGLMPRIYLDTLNEIKNEWNFVPTLLKEWSTIANVGVIGGSNLDFFDTFCQLSTSMLMQNKSFIDKSSNGYINQMLEEYLFVCLARDKKLKIDYLINFDRNKHPVEQFTRFHLTPMSNKYVHLIGSMKQNIYSCEQIEVRLKLEFPSYYKEFSKLLINKYPSFIEDTKNFKFKRLEKLSETIKNLYTLSVKSFIELRLVISDDVELVEEINQNNMVTYFLIERNILTDNVQKRELKGLENLLLLFEKPCSIFEAIKQVEEEYKFNDRSLANLQSNLIDMIAKEVFVNMALTVAY